MLPAANGTLFLTATAATNAEQKPTLPLVRVTGLKRALRPVTFASGEGFRKGRRYASPVRLAVSMLDGNVTGLSGEDLPLSPLAAVRTFAPLPFLEPA